MIPDKLLEEVSPAKSYGLLESIGQGRTDVDQSDGDDAYFEVCAEVYGGRYERVYYVAPGEHRQRRVPPSNRMDFGGKSNQRRRA